MGARVQLPDNGDRPILLLELVIAADADAEACPYAIYEFLAAPELSTADIDAVAMGEAKQDTDFGGELLGSGLVGAEASSSEGFAVAEAAFDINPFDKTYVVVVCPGMAARETEFFVSTLCDSSVDRHLKDGPTIESVAVEIAD